MMKTQLMSAPGKKRPAPLPDPLTIVLTGADLAHLDAYRQAEHDASNPPSEAQEGTAYDKQQTECKRRSDDALRGLLVALIHQAEEQQRARAAD